MEEFRDVVQLAGAIRNRIHGAERPLVGVDGAYGSGKSTLARELAKLLDAAILEIDKYTLKDGRPYRQQLRYEEIRTDLEALRANGEPVIVEGICLLDVVEQVGVRPDVLVYVKRVSGDSGLWRDEDTCDPHYIDLGSQLLQMPGAALAREVASYHLERDPLGKADLGLLMRVSADRERPFRSIVNSRFGDRERSFRSS